MFGRRFERELMFERLQAFLKRGRVAKFTLDKSGSRETGPCECCGDYTRYVTGFLGDGSRTVAGYSIQWTKDKVGEHGAHVDLIIGPWGEGAQSVDRVAVSLAFRHMETGPWFSVIDAASRDVAKSELVGRALARGEVIGTPLAQRVFDMIDTIWCGDDRIAEVTRGAAEQADAADEAH